MALAKNKTQKTTQGPQAYFSAITDAQRQADCRALDVLMRKLTGATPRMWGASIVGYGDRHIRSASGREVDWFLLGFSSRKTDLSLYLSFDIAAYADHLGKLGVHKTGKGCLYIKRLADVDRKVLQDLMSAALRSG